MNEAKNNHNEREEHFEREKQEDAERWEQYQLTGEAVSHEVVSAWLENLAAAKSAPLPIVQKQVVAQSERLIKR